MRSARGGRGLVGRLAPLGTMPSTHAAQPAYPLGRRRVTRVWARAAQLCASVVRLGCAQAARLSAITSTGWTFSPAPRR